MSEKKKSKRMFKRNRYHPDDNSTYHEDSKLSVKANNEMLITTKRLTVGIKGIFGSSRQSRSVLRNVCLHNDRQRSNKSMMSTDIKKSLSRILHKERAEYYDDMKSFHVSKNLNNSSDLSVTPVSTKTKNSFTYSGKTPNSISTSSTVSKGEEVLDLKSYIDISRRLKAMIPEGSYLKKGTIYSNSLRKDLIEAFETADIRLDINPLFAAKCNEERSTIFNEIRNSQEQIKSPSCKKKRDLSVECSKPREHADSFSYVTKECPKLINILDKTVDKSTTQSKEKEVCISASKEFLRASPNKAIKQVYPQNIEEDRSNQQLNFNNILDKPLHSLRSSRRPKNSPQNYYNSKDKYLCLKSVEKENQLFCDSSDFLDLIDSIPIATLERNFLQNVEKRDEFSCILEMKKPVMKSPSPPKMYRMNMF